MAERLGMTVTRLRDEMSVDEFFSWIAFDQYESERRDRELEDAKQEAERERERLARAASVDDD